MLVTGSGVVDMAVAVNTIQTKTSSVYVLENGNYGIYLLGSVGI